MTGSFLLPPSPRSSRPKASKYKVHTPAHQPPGTPRAGTPCCGRSGAPGGSELHLAPCASVSVTSRGLTLTGFPGLPLLVLCVIINLTVAASHLQSGPAGLHPLGANGTPPTQKLQPSSRPAPRAAQPRAAGGSLPRTSLHTLRIRCRLFGSMTVLFPDNSLNPFYIQWYSVVHSFTIKFFCIFRGTTSISVNRKTHFYCYNVKTRD